MTITTPARLMILHLAQRGFTDALTFITIFSIDWREIRGQPLQPLLYLLHSLYYAASCEIVRRKLNQYLVAWDEPRGTHPELLRQVGHNAMPIIELDAPHIVGRRLDYLAFDS